MWEFWVQSLGREDSLEKEMATHFSTLAWKIPWTDEPGRLQSMGLQRVRHDWVTSLSLTNTLFLDKKLFSVFHHYRLDCKWTSLNLMFVYFQGFLGGSAGKESTCKVWSLGWEDLLEKGMATHSSILVWRIPWTVWSLGSQRVGHDWVTFTFPRLAGKESACNAGDQSSIPGWGRSPEGGHGNPFQYSCLENPMDRGAWCTI